MGVMLEDFVTVADFARSLKINRTTVYIAIQENRVNAMDVLGRKVIPRSELLRFTKRTGKGKTKVLRKVKFTTNGKKKAA